jgi:hypothetical protein
MNEDADLSVDDVYLMISGLRWQNTVLIGVVVVALEVHMMASPVSNRENW